MGHPYTPSEKMRLQKLLSGKPAKSRFSDLASLASARDSTSSLILSSCHFISTPRHQRMLLRREIHSSLNLSPFLTATKKNSEKYSYFQLLYFKLVYSLRPSTHKFYGMEEQFYYALATYHISFFSFVWLKISVTMSPSYCRFTINSFLH